MVKPVLSSLLLPATLFVCLLSRQSYFLFAFVLSLFLAIKLPNQKWPPLLSFALSFLGLVASAVTIPFDLPLLQSLYIGTCSDSLCIPPFAYYGSLVFLLFIYLRLQPSSCTLSSHVPLLSNVLSQNHSHPTFLLFRPHTHLLRLLHPHIACFVISNFSSPLPQPLP
ncbi:hypothetical protein P9112_013215 [Eukaryota sp. TZLM1-RC]